MFFVGQKVERIGGEEHPNSDGDALPFRTTFTVSWAGTDAWGYDKIDLVEFPAPESDKFERGYNSIWFRAVVEKKTDISIFTKMLNPDKRRINA